MNCETVKKKLVELNIVLDAQSLQTASRDRGIGRYVSDLVEALADEPSNLTIVLNSDFGLEVLAVKNAVKDLNSAISIQVWTPPFSTWGGVVESETWKALNYLSYELFIDSLNPDIFIVGSLFEGFGNRAQIHVPFGKSYQVGLIFYDLIPYLHRAEYLGPNRDYEDFYLAKFEELQKFDIFFCISESSANELKNHTQTRGTKIVVYAGLSRKLQPRERVDGGEQLQYGGRPGALPLGDYWLYVGGADPRKNLVNLIAALSLVEVSILSSRMLVIAGTISDLEKSKLNRLAKANNVPSSKIVILQNVTDLELQYLYSNCSLFIIPSKHEGFGLPLLEAMAHGAPAISSNATSLPEITALEEASFNPDSPAEIAAKITFFEENPEAKKSLVDASLAKAQKFTWTLVAKRMLQNLEAGEGSNAKLSAEAATAQLLAALPTTLKDCDLLQLSIRLSRTIYRFEQRKMFVDVTNTFLNPHKAGIPRAVENLFWHLHNTAQDEYKPIPVYFDGKSFKGVKTWHLMGSDLVFENAEENLQFTSGDLFIGLDLSHRSAIDGQEELNSMKAQGVEIGFVLFDLLPIRFPQFWPEGFASVHEEWLRCILRHDFLLANSASELNELQNWAHKNPVSLGSNRAMQGHFSLGADPQESPSFLKSPVYGEYFLMVGSLNLRRGHTDVLEAFTQMWEQGFDRNLVIVGSSDPMSQKLGERIARSEYLNSKLFWFSNISDAELSSFYAGSTAVILASLGEGFGLPMIEARLLGKKVIARDIPVFRETASNQAQFFKSGDIDSLRVAISDIDGFRPPPATNEDVQSWSQSAQGLMSKLRSFGALKG